MYDMTTKAQRDQLKKTAALFSLLSSDTRCHILLLLNEHKSLSVQELAKYMKMTHSAISHQLGILVTEKCVLYEKSGRIVHYSLSTSENARLARRALRVFEYK